MGWRNLFLYWEVWTEEFGPLCFLSQVRIGKFLFILCQLLLHREKTCLEYKINYNHKF